MDKVQKVVDVLAGNSTRQQQAHSDPRKIYEDWTKIATGSYSTVFKVQREVVRKHIIAQSVFRQGIGNHKMLFV